MLTNNEKLYEALEAALRARCVDEEYIFVRAIYEPEDDGGPHSGYYSAGVDLYEPGETYRVYFITTENGVAIDSIRRWFMG